MPGAIFRACVRAWACGVCQSDALTLLYTLVCVLLRACTEQNLPHDPLPWSVKDSMGNELNFPDGFNDELTTYAFVLTRLHGPARHGSMQLEPSVRGECVRPV